MTVIDSAVDGAKDGANNVLHVSPRYKHAYMSGPEQRGSLHTAEEERRRLARELHDETLQSLGALRVLLSSARRITEVEPLHAVLERAVQQLTDDIANLRSLITELRPAALDELGLTPALEALFERVRASHGLEVKATVQLDDVGTSRLDLELEATIYRIVQESLTNAGKHSGAGRVDVIVAQRRGGIEIAVRDDGRGFDASAPTSGFGLIGIRERVSIAGGELEIVSSPDGTAVLASLPSPPDGRGV